MSKRKRATLEEATTLGGDSAGDVSTDIFEEVQLGNFYDFFDELALKQFEVAIGMFNHELMPVWAGCRWRVHDAPVRAGQIGNMLLDCHEQMMESLALLSKVALIWASAVETKICSKFFFETRFGLKRKARSDSEPKI